MTNRIVPVCPIERLNTCAIEFTCESYSLYVRWQNTMGMTILLAIETSTELASLALDTRTHLTRELAGTATHSSGVLPAVQSLLNEAGLL